MLNRSASLAMSTSILKALPGKLDIKRHLPYIIYVLHCNTEPKSVHPSRTVWWDTAVVTAGIKGKSEAILFTSSQLFSEQVKK